MTGVGGGGGGVVILQKSPKSTFEAACLEKCNMELYYFQDINICLK